MAYTLINTEIRKATEQIRCDSMRSYYDKMAILRRQEKDTNLKFTTDIVIIMRNKKGFIEQGEEYIYREFVDEEGEVHFLNSGKEMDKVAKRNFLYPSLIINQL